MATKIKLMRLGKIRSPQYRIVVADSRTKREGRAIEEIGIYQPKFDPSIIEVKSERVQYWLGVGAQPTEAVVAILKVTGDWQQFKGLPAPPPMKQQPEKQDRRAAYDAAAAAAVELKPKQETAPKKKASAKKPKDESSNAKDSAEGKAATAAPAEEAASTEAPAADSAEK